MNFTPDKLRLYAVTDRSWLSPGQTLCSVLEPMLANGVTMVQLREKELDYETFLQEAKDVKQLCRHYHVPFLINDRVDIAAAIHADGVHVGLSDMELTRARAILGSDAIIGGSAHNVSEALSAEAAKASYIGCGAVFGSSTKTDVSTLTFAELKRICAAVSIPVVAIGGITEALLPQLYGSGVAGTAIISALFAAPDPGAAAARLRKKLALL